MQTTRGRGYGGIRGFPALLVIISHERPFNGKPLRFLASMGMVPSGRLPETKRRGRATFSLVFLFIGAFSGMLLSGSMDRLKPLQFYLFTQIKNQFSFDDLRAENLLRFYNNTSQAEVNMLETHAIASDVPFGFAACLLNMDDNKILPEWLAYHYEVLPLRRLIVATDPFAVTSPSYILDSYSKHLGMKITHWHDDDFARDGTHGWETVRIDPNLTNVAGQRYKAYLWRQRIFYTTCARQLKKENYTWVALIDVDEYISFNYFDKNASSESVRNCKRISMNGVKCRKDGSPWEMMKYFGFHDGFPYNSTIAAFIHEYWNQTVVEARDGSNVCDVMHRVRMKSIEPPLRVNLPPGFDYREFRTLRYLSHQEIRNMAPGKAILNVQVWEPGGKPLTTHRATESCFNAKIRNRAEPSLSFFQAHHYSGTYEEYLSRPGDGRKNNESYLSANNFTATGISNEMQWWLERFIKRVGHHRALFLTRGLRKAAFENDALSPRARQGNCSYYYSSTLL